MVEPHPFPDQFTQVGSGIYYAIRFAPSQRQSELALANALYRSIADIPLTCSEARVAGQKLQWWQLELERAFAASAQHPVAAAGARWAESNGLDKNFFAPLFYSLGNQIDGTLLEDERALESYLDSTGGLFGELLAIAGGANRESRAHARSLGHFLAHTALLRNIGSDLRQGHCLLPISQLQRHGLTSEALLDATGPRLTALIQESIELAESGYRNTLQALTSKRGIGPLLALGALSERLLKVIRKDGCQQLMRQRTSLTPLRKLWICWRQQSRSV